jgi:DNA-binding transcriptional ArsR family regulator
MPVKHANGDSVSRIAAAIGEPARARMLYALMDDRARTATELAMIGDVNPSTASAHLNRLKDERLVRMLVQGKHRYYSLDGADVASVLEGLTVLAGGKRTEFVPNTPNVLRAARTCYDHLAGTLAVKLYERFEAMGLIAEVGDGRDGARELTRKGERVFGSLGVDVETARGSRRRFAYACLDWSERRAHLGGAIGAAFLTAARKKRWIGFARDSRAVELTTLGARELAARFNVRFDGSGSRSHA